MGWKPVSKLVVGELGKFLEMVDPSHPLGITNSATYREFLEPEPENVQINIFKISKGVFKIDENCVTNTTLIVYIIIFSWS